MVAGHKINRRELHRALYKFCGGPAALPPPVDQIPRHHNTVRFHCPQSGEQTLLSGAEPLIVQIRYLRNAKAVECGRQLIILIVKLRRA